MSRFKIGNRAYVLYWDRFLWFLGSILLPIIGGIRMTFVRFFLVYNAEKELGILLAFCLTGMILVIISGFVSWFQER